MRPLVPVEAAGTQWAHSHAPETSLRWPEPGDMVCYAGRSHQKMETLWSWRDGHHQHQCSGTLLNSNSVWMELRSPKRAKKTSQQPKLLIQGRMDPRCEDVNAEFRPQHQNVTAETETLQTRRLSDKEDWGSSSPTWSLASAADKNTVQCAPQLLQHICLRTHCAVHQKWSSAYLNHLSYCYLSII